MAKVHSPRFLEMVNAARESVRECQIDEFIEMLQDGNPLVVIDVREESEFDAGHLTGSLHLGKGIIERDIEKHGFNDDLRIVLYCGGGFRSAIAAQSLQTMGWTNVYSLWRGWRGILESDLPTSSNRD